MFTTHLEEHLERCSFQNGVTSGGFPLYWYLRRSGDLQMWHGARKPFQQNLLSRSQIVLLCFWAPMRAQTGVYNHIWGIAIIGRNCITIFQLLFFLCFLWKWNYILLGGGFIFTAHCYKKNLWDTCGVKILTTLLDEYLNGCSLKNGVFLGVFVVFWYLKASANLKWCLKT